MTIQCGAAQLAVRRAHNPEVGGSSSPPATLTHALRVAVPADESISRRMRAATTCLGQHGHVVDLPGHLAALSPSPDESNRRHQRSGGVESRHASGIIPAAARMGVWGRLYIAAVARGPLHPQRAGTWHKLRATSARHWPMTHGRDRGAARAANSARHGSECNLPAHLCEAPVA